jgi:arylsulfotransferase ASST
MERPVVKSLTGSAALAFLLGSVAGIPATTVVSAGGSNDVVTVQVTGSPLSNIGSSPLSLSPEFAQTITDYVWRCQSGTNKIQVTFTAVSGGTIAVEGNTGTTLTLQESLTENQAVVIEAPDPNSPDGPPVQYWIRCLPHDFPQLEVTKPGSPPPGWYLTGDVVSSRGSGTYAMVLDNNGTPVWYRKSASPGVFDVTQLADGTIAWASGSGGFGTDPNAAFEDFNLMTGATLWIKAPVSPMDFHELEEMSNGDLMMLSSPLRYNVDLTALGFSSSATIIDCVVQEVGPQGQLVWEWRASDHISAGESTHPMSAKVNGQSAYDIFHCNSIDTDDLSGDVLLSSRHTDAVYLMDKTSGMIIWKMGGTSSNHDNSQILTITDDPNGTFHAQHDARFQANGDISLYDDQSWDVSLAARGVEYHIDTGAGTATLVWSYASPDSHHAVATGSFRRFDGGDDNVIGWGFKANTLFTEVDAAGDVMLNVTFPAGEFAYRVQKVAATAIDHGLLRATAGLPPAVPPPILGSALRVGLEVVLDILAVVGSFLAGFAWLRRRRLRSP